MNDLPEVEIIWLDDPDVVGAAVKMPGLADPLFVSPFRGIRLSQGFPIEQSTVLLVGHRSPYVTSLIKIDANSGEVLQAATLNVHGTARLSKDRRTLYIMGGYPHGLVTIDVAGLTIRHLHDFAVMGGGAIGHLFLRDDYFRTDAKLRNQDTRIFHSPELRNEYFSPARHELAPTPLHFHELDDGRLIFLNEFEKHKSWCLVIVDVTRGILEQLNEQSLVWDQWREIRYLDGPRRALILNNESAIPISNGTDDAEIEVFGRRLPNVRQHPDVAADGVWRYGIAVTIYENGGEQRHTIIVRMEPAAKLKPEYEAFEADEVFDDRLRLAAAQTINPNDSDLRELELSDSSSEGAMRRFKVYGDQIRHKTLGWQFTPLSRDPDGEGFWVWFQRDDCLRRVHYDGRLGPLIKFEPKNVDDAYLPTLEFERDGSIAVHRPLIGVYRFDPREFERHSGPMVLTQPIDPPRQSYKSAYAAFVKAMHATLMVPPD
jgi:hypothetical protein